VAIVQYTYTHKQQIEQHKKTPFLRKAVAYGFGFQRIRHFSEELLIWILIPACNFSYIMLTRKDDYNILKIIFHGIYLSTSRTFDEFEPQIRYSLDGVEQRAQGSFAVVHPGVLWRKFETVPSRWQQCVTEC
jgi:hypothetical protein